MVPLIDIQGSKCLASFGLDRVASVSVGVLSLFSFFDRADTLAVQATFQQRTLGGMSNVSSCHFNLRVISFFNVGS